MISKNPLFLVLILVILQSCARKSIYTSNPKSRPACTGTEIILSKGKKISLNSWTDSYVRKIDSLGNVIWQDQKRNGFGTYTRQGDSITVTFLNEDSITITVNKIDIGERKHYEVRIINEVGNRITPMFMLTDDSLKHIKSIIAQDKNTGVFSETPRTKYSYLKFGDIFAFNPEIIIPIDTLNAGENIFKYKTYAGYYAKGEQMTMYLKWFPFGIRYGPRKRWLAKKYKWELLNKLYLD